MLKLNPRGHREEELIAAQARALEFWSPTGSAVRVLDARDDDMTLLLERIKPGTSLDDEDRAWVEKLEILGGLVAELHGAAAAPPSIPSLGSHAELWREHIDDPGLVRELEALVSSAAGDALVHGDLHPGNALSGPNGWTVIDPTALRADPHVDVWALVCPQAPLDGRFNEHLAAYAAAAGLDPERAHAWARVRAAAECSWPTPLGS